MCEAKNLSKKVGQGAMNLFEQIYLNRYGKKSS